MANALFNVALIITIRDGPDFIKASDLAVLHQKDFVQANEVQAKAKIVITSTWKTFYKFEDLKKELFSRGLVSDIIDITPVLQNRGTEIQCWLDINSVNKYAVIDDNINDIIGHINPGKIIKCSPSIGFTEIEFEKAIDLLA